jgi:hypothetical protein
VTIDSDTVNAIVSVVGVLASTALTVFVRSRVTPVPPVPNPRAGGLIS